jgi:CheY-like chemotaxis protein
MEEEKSKNLKVFFADDDAEDREIFSEALLKAEINAELKTFEDGGQLNEYLHSIDSIHPDIVFLDIHMPCADGTQCLREIRKNKKLDRVPVIMFTSSESRKDIEESFSGGASLYVTKPDNIAQLVKILKTIFSLNWQESLLFPEMRTFVLKGNEFKV